MREKICLIFSSDRFATFLAMIIELKEIKLHPILCFKIEGTTMSDGSLHARLS